MSRLNLCTNPSFENNATDWSIYSGHATIARSTLHPSVGAHSLLVTWASENAPTNQSYCQFAATPGQTYTLSIDVYVPAGNPPIHLNFRTANATSTLFDTKQRLSVTAVAASTTEAMVLAPVTAGHVGNAPVGGVAYVDAALFERTPVLLPYFDGTFAGASWSGTAGNSTSTLVSPPSITVTNDPTNVPPRNIIFVSDSPGASITITRTDPDGAIRPIRTAEAGPLVGGTWSGYDYESPFDPVGGRMLRYTAQPSDGSSSFTATVAALNITQSWLIHPGVPALSEPINGTTLSTVTTQSGATAHQVLGRSTPIFVSDGTRKSKTFNLIIKTAVSAAVHSLTSAALFPSTTLFPSDSLFPMSNTTTTTAGLDALYSLLADTSTLLLQLVYPYTGVQLYQWINVGQVSEDRLTHHFGDPRRILTLECTESDRPAGGIAAQRTWADLIAAETTWQSVLSDFSTWNGALTGSKGS